MVFDETDKPDKPDEPKDPNQQGNDTDVKGAYYPGDSVGGALTGDETELFRHMSIMILVSSVMVFSVIKYRKNKFQSQSK